MPSGIRFDHQSGSLGYRFGVAKILGDGPGAGTRVATIENDGQPSFLDFPRQVAKVIVNQVRIGLGPVHGIQADQFILGFIVILTGGIGTVAGKMKNQSIFVAGLTGQPLESIDHIGFGHIVIQQRVNVVRIKPVIFEKQVFKIRDIIQAAAEIRD